MTIDIVRGTSFVEARPVVDADTTDLLTGTGVQPTIDDVFPEIKPPAVNPQEATEPWVAHKDRCFVDHLVRSMGNRLNEGTTHLHPPAKVRELMGKIAVNPTADDVKEAEKMVSEMAVYKDPEEEKKVDKWEEAGYAPTTDPGELALRATCEAAALPATPQMTARRQARHRRQAMVSLFRAFLRRDTAAVDTLSGYLRYQ